MTKIVLEHLYKYYENDLPTVKDFDLRVQDEEFIVLVGPSGCGKSTTLRMIAGLESISEGSLYIDNILMNEAPPKDRDIAMVFQNYALYPHMNVFDNIAFGLKLRKFNKDTIKQRVHSASQLLGLDGYLDRKPRALSGGQRQRVALGRAIVRNPKVFLMDEPLSNLDAKLRVQMRSEIMQLHHQLKTTTIYVTHDQTEAMTMASRIVVMKDGIIQQIGTPSEVYNYPSNIFVGSFIGSPSMNVVKGKLHNDYFQVGNETFIKVPSEIYRSLRHYADQEILLGIRPEHMSFVDSTERSVSHIDARINLIELTGSESVIYAQVEHHELRATIKPSHHLKRGDRIQFEIDMTHAHFFDTKTEQRIT
ncbi:sugar ABC transporter ATP-binding protein [Bacillaceae bacterium JMAK1]|nr:sugar ABC transporter ATP-binding protein [Bacillaceae bacterium JMAK1]